MRAKKVDISRRPDREETLRIEALPCSIFPKLFPRPIGAAAVALSARMFPVFPEEERAVTKAVTRRRVEFSAGRHCARRAMAQLGYASCAIPAAPDRVPVWPSGLVGSITHTEDYCAAVVASDRAYKTVGIDIEAVNAVSAELADQVLRADETDMFEDRNHLDGADWLTLHFCLKEAAYKVFYPEFMKIIDFQQMRIRLNAAARSFTAEVLIDDYNRWGGGSGRYAVSGSRIYVACWSDCR
jgi:4'-phosphopantetheinyl transferase EntD